MGDCDRMKKYISDYIEDSLDPTTRKEFEKNLEIYPELKTITKNISILPSILHQLPTQKCSDEFMVNLRERIHSGSNRVAARRVIKKYSYAISFLVVVVIAVFGINSIFLQDNDSSVMPKPGEYQINESEPLRLPIKASKNNDVSIKTKDTQSGTSDSSNTIIKSKGNGQAIPVKQTTPNKSNQK